LISQTQKRERACYHRTILQDLLSWRKHSQKSPFHLIEWQIHPHLQKDWKSIWEEVWDCHICFRLIRSHPLGWRRSPCGERTFTMQLSKPSSVSRNRGWNGSWVGNWHAHWVVLFLGRLNCQCKQHVFPHVQCRLSSLVVVGPTSAW
jgi:hypothetical protein